MIEEDKIFEEIKHYVDNSKIKYAILIDGEWGSGKTYFIKNILMTKLDTEAKQNNKDKTKSIFRRFADIIESILKRSIDKIKSLVNKKDRAFYINKYKYKNNKKPIYVSLYGVNSIVEVKSRITAGLIKNEKLKGFLPVLDIVFEGGDKIINKYLSIDNASKKITNILSNFYKLENIIIFFDDLERCSLDINSILGYINQLVEHNNTKVVIVADEKKLGKIDYEKNIELKYIATLNSRLDFEEEPKKDLFGGLVQQKDKLTLDDLKSNSRKIFEINVIYNEIKEKLIGKTINYTPNLENIYDELVDNIIQDKYINGIVKTKKINLIELIHKYNYWNLRTIQFIFETFERLAKISLEFLDERGHKEKYLSELFKYCVLKSFQIKKGENTYNWEEDTEFGVVYLGNEERENIHDKYIKGFKFVDDYLLNSIVDKNRIGLTIQEYVIQEDIENNNPNDPLFKMKNYWLINEYELRELINEAIVKINNNEYVLNLYPVLLYTFLFISEMNICKNEILKAIDILKSNIKNQKVIGKFNDDYFGFPQLGKIKDEFDNHMNDFKRLIKGKEEQKSFETFNYMLQEDNWGEKLKKYCYENEYIIINDRRYVYFLDTNQIVKNIIYKDIQNIYYFYYSLQKIYDRRSINRFAIEDKENLIKLRKTMETNIINIKKQIYKMKKDNRLSKMFVFDDIIENTSRIKKYKELKFIIKQKSVDKVKKRAINCIYEYIIQITNEEINSIV